MSTEIVITITIETRENIEEKKLKGYIPENTPNKTRVRKNYIPENIPNFLTPKQHTGDSHEIMTI